MCSYCLINLSICVCLVIMLTTTSRVQTTAPPITIGLTMRHWLYDRVGKMEHECLITLPLFDFSFRKMKRNASRTEGLHSDTIYCGRFSKCSIPKLDMFPKERLQQWITIIWSGTWKNYWRNKTNVHVPEQSRSLMKLPSWTSGIKMGIFNHFDIWVLALHYEGILAKYILFLP